MKKDFEQAYRELAQNEAPDLWDRIEAGLSDKSTPVLPKEQTETGETTRKQNKIAALLSYRKYVTVAAALLCIAILIPIAGVISRSSGGYSSSGAPAADNGGAETADTSAADTGAAEEAPAAEEGAAEAADGTADQEPSSKYAENVVKEETAVTAEKTPMEMAESEDTADAGMAESMLQSSADSTARGEIAEADEMMRDLEHLNGDEVISHVVIRVTNINHAELSENIEEVGTLYTFLVEEEPSGVLSGGEEYILFVPAYSSYALIEDSVYEVDLGYREREEYSFVLKGYYGETGR